MTFSKHPQNAQFRAAASSRNRNNGFWGWFKDHSILDRLKQTIAENRPVAYRRLDIKSNGEIHLKEYGVGPIRWLVILISIFAIVRLNDPSALINAIVKLAHLP
jgi:hypothetical protein